MFCKKEADIGLSIVYEVISRKDFEDLKSFIHFVDNTAADLPLIRIRIFERLEVFMTTETLKQFDFFQLFTNK